MANNRNTVIAKDFFTQLSSQATKHKIAANLGIDPFKDWYDKAYASALRGIIRMIEDEQYQWNTELSAIEQKLYYEGFKNKLQSIKQKMDNYKQKHMMTGPIVPGKSTPMQHASINEGLSQLWSQKDSDAIFDALQNAGVTGKARKKFQDKHGTHRGFSRAYAEALQNIIPRIKASSKPPFDHSDLKKWEPRIYAIVLHHEPKGSIHRPVKSNDDHESWANIIGRIPKNAGEDPFEKGTYAKIGLNEATGDWTEAKIKKLIDKEVTSILKKEKYLTEKEIKEIIRNSIIRMFKFLWEKSSFFIKQI